MKKPIAAPAAAQDDAKDEKKKMLTVSDEYNSGKTGEHYPGAYVTYNVGAHRLQAGWARTKAGSNCSGGVCRYVPETKGVVISYNYNF